MNQGTWSLKENLYICLGLYNVIKKEEIYVYK